MANQHVLDSKLVHLLLAISWFLVNQDIRSKMVMVEIVNLMIVLFLNNLLESSDGSLVDDVKRSARNEVTSGVSRVFVKHLPPWQSILTDQSFPPRFGP